MSLETERLILRFYKPTDFDDYWGYVKQPNIGPRCGWTAPKTKEDAHKWFDKALTNPLLFAIVLKDSNKYIGTIEIMPNDKHYEEWSSNFENSKEIGAWLAEEFWNGGYMTEALGEILKYCFNILGVCEVFGSNFEPNIGSQRIQEKSGMKFVGRIPNYITWYETDKPCDLMVHKITKEEWQKLNETTQNL